ncbi:unnamed protein product, partial [Boreogadus saida]
SSLANFRKVVGLLGDSGKRYKDHLKTLLKRCDILPTSLESLAANRSAPTLETLLHVMLSLEVAGVMFGKRSIKGLYCYPSAAEKEMEEVVVLIYQG